MLSELKVFVYRKPIPNNWVKCSSRWGNTNGNMCDCEAPINLQKESYTLIDKRRCYELSNFAGPEYNPFWSEIMICTITGHK
jgi:hypothetical protein